MFITIEQNCAAVAYSEAGVVLVQEFVEKAKTFKFSLFKVIFCYLFGHDFNEDYSIYAGRFLIEGENTIRGIEGIMCPRCHVVFPYKDTIEW